MSKFTVHRGRRNRAIIILCWQEQTATNEKIAKMLREYDFTEVGVTVDGHMREARALWPLQNTTPEIPPQVHSVQEIRV